MSTHLHSHHLASAIALAREAGDIIRRSFGSAHDIEHKTDDSLVTAIDREINALVLHRLTELYPEYNILSEEGAVLGRPGPYTWVCDPIDGTKPYTMEIPVSMFALALCHEGVPVLGVNYDPYLDHMYTAIRGSGAYMDDTRIHVNTTSTVTRRTTVGFAGSGYSAYPATDRVTSLMREGYTAVNLGSTHQMGSHLARGHYCGLVFCGDTAHDIASLKVIVEEAGGRVTDLWGQDQRYDRPIRGAILSNGILHDHLLTCIKDH